MVIRSSEYPGFLLLEIAITMVLISSFYAIFAGYLCQIGSWQTQAHTQIEATNYASSCFELLKYQPFLTTMINKNFELSIKREKLSYSGRWNPSLDSQELQMLHDYFQLIIVTIEWKTNRKHSFTFLSGEMI